MTFEELLAKHGFGEPECASGVGPGWFDILDELLPKLRTLGADRLGQVKEKFGGLRVYLGTIVDSASEDDVAAMSALIAEAEKRSELTCEECGQPGRLRRGGWVLTLCDEHAEAHEKRKKGL